MEFRDRPPEPDVSSYESTKISTSYFIHQKDSSPPHNTDFMDTVFKIVRQQKSIDRPLSAIAKAFKIKFTSQHYESLLPSEDASLSYTHLNTVLDYSSVHAMSAFEINIKQHFVGDIIAYTNCVW